MVPGWLRLAIDSQNKARNGFVSTIKTCDLDSVTIQHPILNIKSGFPQNMILGHLFSVLRASDLQKGWDSEGRGDFKKKKNLKKKHLHRVLQSEFLIGKKFHFKFTGGIYKYIAHFLVA